ncbi:MAG TPA: HupE/UreJ family protein [Alphaproteobacteria bacterium]|nr:HupE/UreJ family protein [Alphaproteobacteria bacterium]
MRRIALAASALILGSSGMAFAHVPGAGEAGLAAGFAHPLLGLDHVLAMVAVGLWASQLGGRALWLVPASFVAVMALGAALGTAGVLPAVELGIVGSLLVLGLLIASATRVRVAAGAALAAVFALFHGHAHGAEMTAGAPALYAAGFIAATALLHGIGVAAGLYWQHAARGWLVRAGGAAVAAAGLVLLMA